RRRHTRFDCDWSSDVCSSDLVYGPGLRKQLFWDAARKATHGEFDFFGSGEELRDWVYVEDLARLLADLGAAPREFPRLSNVGTEIGRASCRERVEVESVAEAV